MFFGKTLNSCNEPIAWRDRFGASIDLIAPTSGIPTCCEAAYAQMQLASLKKSLIANTEDIMREAVQTYKEIMESNEKEVQ